MTVLKSYYDFLQYHYCDLIMTTLQHTLLLKMDFFSNPNGKVIDIIILESDGIKLYVFSRNCHSWELEKMLMIGFDHFSHRGSSSLLLARDCRPYINHVLVSHRG